MPDDAVKVKGVKQLSVGAKRLADLIGDDRAPDAFLGVADDAAGAVRVKVPRVSGALAGSTATAISRSAKKPGARVGIGKGLVYAGPVEFGGYPPGRPFVKAGRYLFPTALDVVPQLEAAGKDAARDGIRGFRWSKPK